jgi:cytochrome c2
MRKVLIGCLGAITLLAAPAFAQDAAEGEKVFKKCQACHAVGEGAANKVGPVLNGVFGRAAGVAPDFKYSDAMIEAGAGGLVWDEANLDVYLTKPKDLVEGTKMAFPGLRKEEDRANIIAYLKTFSEDS